MIFFTGRVVLPALENCEFSECNFCAILTCVHASFTVVWIFRAILFSVCAAEVLCVAPIGTSSTFMCSSEFRYDLMALFVLGVRCAYEMFQTASHYSLPKYNCSFPHIFAHFPAFSVQALPEILNSFSCTAGFQPVELIEQVIDVFVVKLFTNRYSYSFCSSDSHEAWHT